MDWENTLTYDRIFGAHNLGLMASTTANEYQYRSFSAAGHDFTNESAALMYFSQAGHSIILLIHILKTVIFLWFRGHLIVIQIGIL